MDSYVLYRTFFMYQGARQQLAIFDYTKLVGYQILCNCLALAGKGLVHDTTVQGVLQPVSS